MGSKNEVTVGGQHDPQCRTTFLRRGDYGDIVVVVIFSGLPRLNIAAISGMESRVLRLDDERSMQRLR